MSTLNDATTPGEPCSYPSTPGEFAARWNGWSEERRAWWLAERTKTAEVATSCFAQDHHGQLESLRYLERRGPAIDVKHLTRQREWSEAVFGPGSRAAGVVDHIRKELTEIEEDPADLAEWVDVVILALDGAWRAGHSPEAIIGAIKAKQARNEGRTWPDWRTADPERAIEHVR